MKNVFTQVRNALLYLRLYQTSRNEMDALTVSLLQAFGFLTFRPDASGQAAELTANGFDEAVYALKSDGGLMFDAGYLRWLPAYIYNATGKKAFLLDGGSPGNPPTNYLDCGEIQ